MTLLSFVPLLSFMLWEVSRHCSLSLTDCVLFWNAQSAASRHCDYYSVFIRSLSQVQVGPLSAVPRDPLVPPAALTATLNISLSSREDQSFHPGPKRWGPCGAPQLRSLWSVCGNAGSPFNFFGKSTVQDVFLQNSECHRAKGLRWILEFLDSKWRTKVYFPG